MEVKSLTTLAARCINEGEPQGKVPKVHEEDDFKESEMSAVQAKPDSEVDFLRGRAYIMRHWDVVWKHYAQSTTLQSPHDKPILGSVFIRNKNRALTTGVDGKICLWNLQTGELEWVKCTCRSDAENEREAVEDEPFHAIKQFVHSKKIEAIAISVEGDVIATASADGTAVVWALREQLDQNNSVRFSIEPVLTCKHLLDGEIDPVTAVAFSYPQEKSPQRKYLATGSGKGRVRIFDAMTGDCMSVYDQSHQPGIDWIRGVCFSQDNSTVFAASTGSVVEWDLQTGRRAANEDVDNAIDSATTMAVAPYGVAWGTLFGGIGIGLRKGTAIDVEGVDAVVNAITWSADGKLVVAGTMDEPTPDVFLYKLLSERCEQIAILEKPLLAQLFISTIVISPDNGDIIIGDCNGKLILYSIRRLAERVSFRDAQFLIEQLPPRIRHHDREHSIFPEFVVRHNERAPMGLDHICRYVDLRELPELAQFYKELDVVVRGMIESCIHVMLPEPTSAPGKSEPWASE